MYFISLFNLLVMFLVREGGGTTRCVPGILKDSRLFFEILSESHGPLKMSKIDTWKGVLKVSHTGFLTMGNSYRSIIFEPPVLRFISVSVTGTDKAIWVFTFVCFSVLLLIFLPHYWANIFYISKFCQKLPRSNDRVKKSAWTMSRGVSENEFQASLAVRTGKQGTCSK